MSSNSRSDTPGWAASLTARWMAATQAPATAIFSNSRRDLIVIIGETAIVGGRSPFRSVGRNRLLPRRFRTTERSGELHGALRQSEPKALDGVLRVHAGFDHGPQRHEEGREVLGAGVGDVSRRGGALEVEERVDVTGRQRAVEPVVELHRPGRRMPVRPGMPVHLPQVVGAEAAPDYEDPLIT